MKLFPHTREARSLDCPRPPVVKEGCDLITSRTLKRTGKKVYDVRLRTPDGRVYNRTFATKKAAEAFEEAEKTDRRRGGMG
jgi:hypothetical protein